MTRRIVPFSNGTEAMIWMEQNCDICKTKSGCSARNNVEKGFITGDISINAAISIGWKDDDFPDKCQMKDKRNINKYVRIDKCQLKIM